jgi:hypothetical protein
MGLSDDELTALHGMLEEWVQSSEFWIDEDSEHKSSMFGKVRDEAKRRGFWWAR